MNYLRTLFCALSAILTAVAEEPQSSINTGLNSTTLTGNVDTSGGFWFGTNVPPANDNFANAEALTNSVNAVTATLIGATSEPGEPGLNINSIWYRWTAPVSGRARLSFSPLAVARPPEIIASTPPVSDEPIFYPWGGFGVSTNGGGFGSVIEINNPVPPLFQPNFAVYSGNAIAALTPVTATATYVEFDVVAGSTYMVSVQESGFSLFSTSFVFYTDISPRASNDDFANAFDLGDVSSATFDGVAAPATREPGEPSLTIDEGAGSVWVHWKAPTYGNTSLTVNWRAAIFRGTSLSDLKLVAVAQFNSPASFFAEAGVDYWFAFWGFPEVQEYSATLQGPQYRLFETTMDQIMPAGALPYFYGLRGQTALLYEKSDTGWTPVEFEAIKDYACAFVIRPEAALNGSLRVVTIDTALPSPHVSLETSGDLMKATLFGFPGQTCFISTSTDLATWSQPTTVTLHANRQSLGNQSSTETVFYRVVQAYAELNVPPVRVEPPH